MTGHVVARAVRGVRAASDHRDRFHPRRQPKREDGVSLLELLFVCALVVTLTATAIPVGAAAVDDVRAAAAARYLVTRARLARLEAAKRSVMVGFRFQRDETGYRFLLYADGNGDGVRTRDIARRIDVPLGYPERLPDQFPGVDFGLGDGVGPIDEDTPAGGNDAIRVGRSDILSFSPLGSASSGTLYLKGRGRQQYAVRIVGVTGRVRLWRYDFTHRTWNAR